jgi:hypothetical protein
MADEGIILRAFNASITTYHATASAAAAAASASSMLPPEGGAGAPAPAPAPAPADATYAHYLAASGALLPAPPPLALEALPAPCAAPQALLTAEDFCAPGDASSALDEYERALEAMEEEAGGGEGDAGQLEGGEEGYEEGCEEEEEVEEEEGEGSE